MPELQVSDLEVLRFNDVYRIRVTYMSGFSERFLKLWKPGELPLEFLIRFAKDDLEIDIPFDEIEISPVTAEWHRRK